MYVAGFVAFVSTLAVVWRAITDKTFGDTQMVLAGLVSSSMAFIWGKGGGDRK